MAEWQPVKNLKKKLQHHPPVVVFFLCLLILAGAFISIGIYSQNHDIENPDISMDWNKLLGSIASLKFCTHLNSTENLSRKQEEDSPPLLYHAAESITNASQNSLEVDHMFMLVPLVGISDQPNHNSISASLLGSQLGFRDAVGKALFNISLFLHLQSPTSEPSSDLDLKLHTNSEINPKSSISCLRISAPVGLLPLTPKPSACPVNDKLEKDASPVRALAIDSNKLSSHNTSPCLSLEFTRDPKLTALLSQAEKALARYHLMLVSMVLLIICSMMALAGTLTCSRSRRHLAKDLHFQKETLLGS